MVRASLKPFRFLNLRRFARQRLSARRRLAFSELRFFAPLRRSALLALLWFCSGFAVALFWFCSRTDFWMKTFIHFKSRKCNTNYRQYGLERHLREPACRIFIFLFFLGYFTFYFALECCFCLSVFFCQLFPSGDFLGIFFFLRFHFWSWFRDLFFLSRQFLIFVNSCCCYAGSLLLLHLTYYFIACKKIILKNTDHPLK